MTLEMRPYAGEEDYWRIRAFLREIFPLAYQEQRTWLVTTLDYWRWHVVATCGEFERIDDVIFLWETRDGRIAAVLHPQGRGDAYLDVHPAFRTPELEAEMINVAEERLSVPDGNGRRKLCIWVCEHDPIRQEVVAQRGYVRGDWPEYERWRSLDEPIPEVPIPAGYVVRAMGDVEENAARSWASWRGFHENESDEGYGGTWYHAIQRLPLYRRDLDIVAVAPSGEIGAFCTLWYDDVTRTGYFEPVATVPEHRRLGLGKAVMFEAMRRLKRCGGTRAVVGGFSPEANALYASVMGTLPTRIEQWEKAW